MLRCLLFGMSLSFVTPDEARAVCIHNGELYAVTTIEQEFAESLWVVRAKVLSSRDWENEMGIGTLYRLQVLESFKGQLAGEFTFSTERNSGGFYLDDGPDPDIGGEYLLFLVPDPRSYPVVEGGTLWVNYACGVSKRWVEVTSQERSELSSLSNSPSA